MDVPNYFFTLVGLPGALGTGGPIFLTKIRGIMMGYSNQPLNFNHRSFSADDHSASLLVDVFGGGVEMDRTKEITKTISVCLEDELSTADKKLPPKVQQAADCIRKNLLNEELTVAWLHRECGMHNHNFSEVFAFYLGRPPKRYIQLKRIVIAKKILLKPQFYDVPLSVVAHELGFSRLSTFSKAFKRETGTVPSKWKGRSE